MLGEEKDEWTCETGANFGRQLVIVVVFCVEGFVVGLFNPLVLFALEKHRSVRLLQKKDGEDQYEGVEAGDSIEDPAPNGILSYEAACDRSKGRSQERHERIDCNGFSAVFTFEKISKNAATLEFVRVGKNPRDQRRWNVRIVACCPRFLREIGKPSIGLYSWPRRMPC